MSAVERVRENLPFVQIRTVRLLVIELGPVKSFDSFRAFARAIEGLLFFCLVFVHSRTIKDSRVSDLLL